MAILSFSGAKRRARPKTGRSLVGIKCCTPFLTTAVEKGGFKRSGNSLRTLRNLLLVGSTSVRWLVVAELIEQELIEQEIPENVSASIKRWFRMSTSRLCWRKKSAPRSERLTSAAMRRAWKMRPPKRRGTM